MHRLSYVVINTVHSFWQVTVDKQLRSNENYLFSVVNRNKEAEDLQNALHLLEASVKDSGVAVNEEEGRSLIGTGSLDSSSLDGLTPDDLLLLLRTTGSDEVDADTYGGNGDGIPGDNGDESPGPSE